jgi:hypothetical protein
MRRMNLAKYRMGKAHENLQESEDAQIQLEHAKEFVEEAENLLQVMIKEAEK